MSKISVYLQKDYNLPLGVRLAICILAFVFVAIPMVIVDHLPFVDYPNHLARFHVWQNLEGSEYLSKFYEKRHALHPYWAVRLFMNGLSPLIGLDAAGRVFVIAATLMPVVGGCCLGWVIAKRVSLLPLASLSVTYNFLAAWGFHNFLFASGLALMTFALWIAMRGSSAWKRVAVMMIAVALLAVMHLLAVAILGLFLFAWEFAGIVTTQQIRSWAQRIAIKCFEIGIVILPAVAFYFALDASAKGETGTIVAGLFMRYVSLVSPFVLFGTETDVLFSAAPLLLIFAAIGSGVFGLSKKAIVVVVIVFLATLIAPYKLFGVAINWRIPLFLVIFLISAVSSTGREIATRNGVAIAISALIIMRVFDVSLQLKQSSAEIAELQNAGAHIERGSRVLPVLGNIQARYLLIRPGDRYAHYGAYLVPTRDIMFPLLFPYFDIQFRPPYDNSVLAASRMIKLEDLSQDEAYFAQPDNRWISYAKNWRSQFDYLLVFGEAKDEAFADGTVLISKGSYFQIHKIGSGSS